MDRNFDENWKTASGRERAEYLGLVAAGAIVRRMPFRLLAALAKPMGSVAFHWDHRGRSTALENLDCVFGESKTAKEKRRIAKAGYQTFARTMLELFWSPNLTPEMGRKIFHVSGHFAEDTGRPTIYVTAHFSNFEMLSQNVPLQREAGIVITQSFRNPLLRTIFDQLRASTGHTIVPQERALIRMMKHLKAGGYFNAVIDLNLDPREASVIIDQFSGLKTCVTQIHAALALRTGARIVPAECHPRSDGTYDLTYHPPLEISPDTTAAEIAQMCWDVLEPGILKHPEGWLWSYKHWRYRPTHEDASRYPSYSNHAKRFDSALKKYRQSFRKSQTIADPV